LHIRPDFTTGCRPHAFKKIHFKVLNIAESFEKLYLNSAHSMSNYG
jgi:hypothetical protein